MPLLSEVVIVSDRSHPRSRFFRRKDTKAIWSAIDAEEERQWRNDRTDALIRAQLFEEGVENPSEVEITEEMRQQYLADQTEIYYEKPRPMELTADEEKAARATRADARRSAPIFVGSAGVPPNIPPFFGDRDTSGDVRMSNANGYVVPETQ
jgi:hypothetical protein